MDQVTYKCEGFTPDHAGNRTRALALVTAADVATSELVRYPFSHRTAPKMNQKCQKSAESEANISIVM